MYRSCLTDQCEKTTPYDKPFAQYHVMCSCFDIDIDPINKCPVTALIIKYFE